METVPSGLSTASLARFVEIATDALSGAREEIDALNVYPVPDGDTGTNMFLTVSAARDAITEALAADPDLPLPDAMRILSRGALLGRRSRRPRRSARRWPMPASSTRAVGGCASCSTPPRPSRPDDDPRRDRGVCRGSRCPWHCRATWAPGVRPTR